MKGTDLYGTTPQYSLDTTQEFPEDAVTAAEVEAQLILGLAKSLGAQGSNDLCGDLYGVAERLAGLLHCDEDDEDDEQPEHMDAGAEVLAGYSGCMNEALRYLIEDEGLPVTHPLVQGLAHHLLTQQRLLEQQLIHQDCRNLPPCDR
ncbi:hypothetical protein B566_EDAN010623 [Ephemera danica]|nr:hypothetical protein B566_EDAN010623 [Ephemera danica]